MEETDSAPAAAGTDRGSGPLDPVLWLIGALWQYKWLILAIVVAGLTAAFMVATRLPDVYTANGLLEIDPQPDNLLEEERNTGFVPPETITETEVQVISSTSVLADVVDTLDLEYSRSNPVLASAPGEADLDRERARSAIVTALQKDLSVSPTGRSYIVEVGFEARDPEFAARVVNATMRAYLGVEVSKRRSQARDVISGLSGRLEELRRELDARERAVQEFRSSSRIAEGAGTDILSEQLARLNEELIRAQGELARARASSGQRSGANEALPEVVNSPLIQELRAQAATQERAVSELEALYRPSHPKLIQARGALAALRDTIAEETEKIAQSLGTSARTQSQRVEALQAEVESLRDRLNAQREAEIELRRLEREVEAARKVYEAFLDRFNEVQGTTGLEQPDGRIIAEAVPPARPSGPNRLLVLAGGGILSGGVAFALVVALALIDSRIRTTADVARATGLAPVAVVPPVPSGRGGLSAFGGRRRNAAFANAITHLRAALLLGSGARGPVIVAMTADDATGHAALATALAQASAVAGDEAVLVDADFGEGSVARLLDGKTEYGLAEIVAERGDVDAALQRDPASSLLYLSAGQGTDPALYRSAAMQDLLDTLYRRFDVIVVNLPPLLRAPDAQALAAEADVTAIVAHAGRAERAALGEIASMLAFAHGGGRLATVLIRD